MHLTLKLLTFSYFPIKLDMIEINMKGLFLTKNVSGLKKTREEFYGPKIFGKILSL